MEIDTMAESRSLGSGFRRRLSVLVGISAVTATLLAAFESDSGRREEEAFVRSSRASIQIFAELAGSAPLTQFAANGLRRAIQIDVGAGGRVLATRGASSEATRLAMATAEAQSAAAQRYAEAVRAMSRVPTDSPIDPGTRALLTSDLPRVRRLLEEQNRLVDRADRYGTRQERAMFAIALVAIAAVLLGLAGLVGDGRGGAAALGVAAAALALALGWGGSGLFV
jgi:hypothetical protein